MNIIPFGQRLLSQQHEISITSYNILLPNNTEGWWIPKCYPPTTPQQHRTWTYRKAKLIHHLTSVSADIICLQEVAQSSWKEDFAELWNQNYEGIIHKKNNLFRCATWYRSNKFALLETRHSFRTLVHIFQDEHGPFGVINVHLSGGPHPKTRMAQLHEALSALKKICNSHNLEASTLPVLLCGDFNCDPIDTPMHRFLTQGELHSDERNELYPNIQLTKKGKKHIFSGLSSAYHQAFGSSPPTLFGRPLISNFCIPHTTQELLHARSSNTLKTLIKPETLHAIELLFNQYAQRGVMNSEACVQWIHKINGAMRGGEKTYVEQFNHQLTLEQFVYIYIQNLNHGLWWSLASDLHQHNIPLPDGSKDIYQDALDHIFIRHCTATSIQNTKLPVAIPQGLPCSAHPSDHLPIGVVVERTNRKPQP